MSNYLMAPDPEDPRLSTQVDGVDHNGQPITAAVVRERAITLYLNSQEIVTVMTIGDFPDLLAVGYLVNQHMLLPDDEITDIDYDEELEVVVVRTVRETDYEEKLKKKVRTSGCAQGTVFGDVMDEIEQVELPTGGELRTSWLGTSPRRSTPRRASIWLPARSMAACCASKTSRWSIWKMWAATMRWTKLPAGCA